MSLSFIRKNHIQHTKKPGNFDFNMKSRFPGFLRDCGQQDLNLHGLPLEPKSSASANSAMPAYIYDCVPVLCLSSDKDTFHNSC